MNEWYGSYHQDSTFEQCFSLHRQDPQRPDENNEHLGGEPCQCSHQDFPFLMDLSQNPTSRNCTSHILLPDSCCKIQDTKNIYEIITLSFFSFNYTISYLKRNQKIIANFLNFCKIQELKFKNYYYHYYYYFYIIIIMIIIIRIIVIIIYYFRLLFIICRLLLLLFIILNFCCKIPARIIKFILMVKVLPERKMLLNIATVLDLNSFLVLKLYNGTHHQSSLRGISNMTRSLIARSRMWFSLIRFVRIYLERCNLLAYCEQDDVLNPILHSKL